MSLQVSKISKIFATDQGRFEVLLDISFEVEEGQFVVLVGPSGCGKSTLLRIMMGLEKATAGHVTFNEQPIVTGDGKMTMIFQHFALFPWLSVYENVEFGLKMLATASAKRSEIVEELIEEVGLGGFADKHPKELSGGMRQRVGVARALALSPKLLLMDEPFGALDAFTAATLREDLLKLWHKRKMTVVMVTHLVEEAVEMADRVVVFTPIPGKVEASVDVKLPRPRDKRSKEFFDLEDKLLDLVKA